MQTRITRENPFSRSPVFTILEPGATSTTGVLNLVAVSPWSEGASIIRVPLGMGILKFEGVLYNERHLSRHSGQNEYLIHFSKPSRMRQFDPKRTATPRTLSPRENDRGHANGTRS